MKRTSKKLYSENKLLRKKTGGGSYTPIDNPINDRFFEIVRDQVEPLSNIHDSDAHYHGK